MPDITTSPPLGRRGVLAAGGAIGLGAALAACGGVGNGGGNGGGSEAEAGGSGTAARTGPWSFKDDRGVVAKADSTPRHIVAFVGTAAALHDYGIEVTGVFGPTTKKDGSPDVQAGDLDVRKVMVIGNVYGEFRVTEPIYSYAQCAPILDALARAIGKAQKVS